MSVIWRGMEQMSERRKSLKINQPFQDRFLLEIVVLIFIVINVLLALMLHFGGSQGAGGLTISVALIIGFVEFAALGFLYWYLLKSSHRIAGPIYALQGRLRELSKGDLTVALAFRKKDHFHETSESFNECVSELRSRLIVLRNAAETLRDKAPEGSETADLAAHLVRELKQFKTE